MSLLHPLNVSTHYVGACSVYHTFKLQRFEGEIRTFFCHSFVNCGLRHFGNDVLQLS